MDTFANDVKERWICCQIGAREHYSIPAELIKSNRLELLLTDYWYSGKPNPVNAFSRNLQGRRHARIPDNKVVSFNFKSLFFEGSQRLKKKAGWELVMLRNEWFQKRVMEVLQNREFSVNHIFSYSYAARHVLMEGRQRGWKTSLGQIDPGPEEEKIVMEEVKRYPQYQSEWQPAPIKYWNDWREECECADEIIVNSEWSLQALRSEGIEVGRVKVVPLTYTIPFEARNFKRHYPDQFNHSRPLRILFLGQVILRKGIARVIETAKKMLGEPVEFLIVGPVGIHPLPSLPNLKWIGRVARIDAERYFKSSDVFLFPTLSDGFGLTQLEARAWQLPVITTRFCGDVVNNGFDGMILDNPDPESIVDNLKRLLESPFRLQEMSDILKKENQNEF